MAVGFVFYYYKGGAEGVERVAVNSLRLGVFESPTYFYNNKIQAFTFVLTTKNLYF